MGSFGSVLPFNGIRFVQSAYPKHTHPSFGSRGDTLSKRGVVCVSVDAMSLDD